MFYLVFNFCKNDKFELEFCYGVCYEIYIRKVRRVGKEEDLIYIRVVVFSLKLIVKYRYNSYFFKVIYRKWGRYISNYGMYDYINVVLCLLLRVNDVIGWFLL